MAEQSPEAAGIEERISRLFPGMVWPEFPWRDGSRLIPIDRALAENLFALIPDWAGDWTNFENALRKHGNFTTAELPNASIKNISQAAGDQAQKNRDRRAALGLVCSGASGTSVPTFHTPVALSSIADATSASSGTEDEAEKVAKRILAEDKTLIGVDELLEALLKEKACGSQLCDSDTLAEKAIGTKSGRAKIRTALVKTKTLLLTTSHGQRGGGVGLTALGERVIRRVLDVRSGDRSIRIA